MSPKSRYRKVCLFTLLRGALRPKVPISLSVTFATNYLDSTLPHSLRLYKKRIANNMRELFTTTTTTIIGKRHEDGRDSETVRVERRTDQEIDVCEY